MYLFTKLWINLEQPIENCKHFQFWISACCWWRCFYSAQLSFRLGLLIDTRLKTKFICYQFDVVYVTVYTVFNCLHQLYEEIVPVRTKVSFKMNGLPTNSQRCYSKVGTSLCIMNTISVISINTQLLIDCHFPDWMTGRGWYTGFVTEPQGLLTSPYLSVLGITGNVPIPGYAIPSVDTSQPYNTVKIWALECCTDGILTHIYETAWDLISTVSSLMLWISPPLWISFLRFSSVKSIVCSFEELSHFQNVTQLIH